MFLRQFPERSPRRAPWKETATDDRPHVDRGVDHEQIAVADLRRESLVRPQGLQDSRSEEAFIVVRLAEDSEFGGLAERRMYAVAVRP